MKEHREERHATPTVPASFGIRSVAIIGLGLMGGSLGLALKRYCPDIKVMGYARREETRKLALEMKACDQVTDDIVVAVRDAEMVVFCTPILDIPNLVAKVRGALHPGTIVTDVGSTKAMLMEQVGDLLANRDACFVGSHPMAGSERTGMEAAQDSLYVDAVVIVTPPDTGVDKECRASSAAATDCRPPDSGIETEVEGRNPLRPDSKGGSEFFRSTPCAIVQGLWRAVGARVVVIGASEHDAIVAGTSHVPHLVAALLVRAAARVTDQPGPYCGTGFKDATRIASGSEWVWHDIVKSNASSIAYSLQGVRSDIDMLLDALDREDFDAVRELLGEARALREGIVGGRR